MYSRRLPLTLLTLLALLLAVSAHSPFRPIHQRQDNTSGGDGTTDTGSTDGTTDGTTDASAQASVDDTGAASTDAGASSDAAATTSAAASTSTSGILGGAGQGGSYPSACANCDSTYTLVNLCSSEGSSESCSPICSNWTSSINCLSCLLSNGQPGIDTTTVQQIVWNLEASCASLEITVSSIDITATATTTGPFVTPSATITSSATSRYHKHSGVTVYNDITKTAVSASLSVAVNPSSTGAASRRTSSGEKGVAMAALGLLGAMML